VTDQYEGWNREMLLNLIRELKGQVAEYRDQCSKVIAGAAREAAEARRQIAELEGRNGWRTLTKDDKPRYFEAFLLEWDNHWQRAVMLGAVKPSISIYWHGQEDIRPFADLIGRRWMRIPALPKEAR
jgi:hypothetical protein